ncbi:MAG: CRISPR-associated endonuclease Cas2 [Gemmataceae bacterium]
MFYIVAYDIADPSRLRRVARTLEKHALRLQKSVFLFEGNANQIQALLEQTQTLLNLQMDVLQAWPLAETKQPLGFTCGSPANVQPSAIVLGHGEATTVPNE